MTLMTSQDLRQAHPRWPTPGRLAISALCLLTAGLWNPWTADWLMGSAWIEADAIRLALLAVGSGLLLWAVRTLLWPHSRFAAAVHALLFTTFLVLPLAFEVILRVGIVLDLRGFRKEALYADRLSDDDYYKLRESWRPAPTSSSLHPLLGWRMRASHRNPLAIHRTPFYTVRTEGVVLCYGDSFMASLTPIPTKIPDVIDAALPSWTAYNYGTGGFGVGQIYLRFLETNRQFVDPIVVVGIMLLDLDRTILSVRDRPKPCFKVRDEELVIEGPPLPTDAADWYAQNPPTLRSFALAYCIRRLRLAAAGGRWSDVLYRQEDKRRVNRAVIEAIIAEARERDLRLLFATFPHNGTSRLSWRDEFMAELFEELDVPCVDGRTVLWETAKREGKHPREFFRDEGHPNVRGNEILGLAIADRVKQLWEWEVIPPLEAILETMMERPLTVELSARKDALIELRFTGPAGTPYFLRLDELVLREGKYDIVPQADIEPLAGRLNRGGTAFRRLKLPSPRIADSVGWRLTLLNAGSDGAARYIDVSR